MIYNPGSTKQSLMDYDEEWQHNDLWPNGSYSNGSSSGAWETPLSQLLDEILKIVVPITMFCTMVSLGCTMQWSKIKDHMKRPRGMMLAAGAQFGIMPLSAFVLAKAFKLEPLPAVAVLICGCCPGGTLSNMLTLPIQGDMNLSIVMTSCSSVLALAMMPLLLYVYCQGFPGLVGLVPYGRIILGLVLTIVPCTIGILITHFRPQWTRTTSKIILGVLTVAILLIVAAAVTTVGKHILLEMSPSLIAIGSLMPLIGFILGYGLAALFKLNESSRRTISIETGCQNIQLAHAILKLGFPPGVIGNLSIFPFVYILFQLIEAGVLILVSRCYQRYKTKHKAAAEELFQPTDAYIGVEVVREHSPEC
ncbi:unnamed protein product [Gadus morhua 'NCC']